MNPLHGKKTFAILLLVALLAAGCTHSHVIRVNLVNHSDRRLQNIIVDYPGATFGVPSLDPGKTFQYAIKPSENGILKIEFTDAQGKIKRFPGPAVAKNQEGAMEIQLTPEGVQAM